MAVTLVLGDLRHIATVLSPTTVANSDGGFETTYAPLTPPTWRCAIENASARAMERAFSGTVIAQATHLFTGRYHAGITTDTRLIWTDRFGVSHTANALAVNDTDGAGVETVVLAVEQIGAVTAIDTSWLQTGWMQGA